MWLNIYLYFKLGNKCLKKFQIIAQASYKRRFINKNVDMIIYLNAGNILLIPHN